MDRLGGPFSLTGFVDLGKVAWLEVNIVELTLTKDKVDLDNLPVGESKDWSWDEEAVVNPPSVEYRMLVYSLPAWRLF